MRRRLRRQQRARYRKRMVDLIFFGSSFVKLEWKSGKVFQTRIPPQEDVTFGGPGGYPARAT